MTHKQEAIKILQGGYGEQLCKTAVDYVAPFWWGPKGELSHQGCVFFLKLNGCLIAVTADHVFQQFRKDKQQELGLLCNIYNSPFEPERQLIDRDSELDLATFHIDEDAVKFIGKKVYEPDMCNWPPKPPGKSKGVFLAGFLLSERDVAPTSHVLFTPKPSIGFSPYCLILTATSIDDRKIMCQLERENMVDIQSKGRSAQREWFGSFSGAPVWTVVKTPVWHWRLAGVIVEYLQEYELLRIHRPDSIMKNGKLLR